MGRHVERDVLDRPERAVVEARRARRRTIVGLGGGGVGLTRCQVRHAGRRVAAPRTDRRSGRRGWRAWSSPGSRRLVRRLRAGRRVHRSPRRSYRLRRMMANALAMSVTASRTMIAADVSARNSSCGLRAQSKMMTGSAVYEPIKQSLRCAPAENDPRTAPTRISGAVSPIARDSARTVPGQDARCGSRQHELANHLPARRADAEARLAQGRRARTGSLRPR